MTRGGLFKPSQEPDRIAVGRIVAVAAGALLIFAAGIAWSTRILWTHDGARMVPELATPMPANLDAAKHGMIDEWLLEGDGRYRSPRDAQRARLDSYGFIDRQKGIVHIPIAEAMRSVALHGDQLERPPPPPLSPAQPGPTPALSPGGVGR